MNQDHPPERVGIYLIPNDELTAPAAEQTYLEKAVWTPDGWEAGANGGVIERAHKECPEVIPEALKREFSNRNQRVLPPEDVPGEIVKQEPVITAADAGYQFALRPEARGGDDSDDV